MAALNTTIDHREIRQWVERHGGQPALKRAEGKGEIALLGIDSQVASAPGSLEPISWDEWFQLFEQQQLAFLYQDGKLTTLELVQRAQAPARSSERRHRPSRTAGAGRARARTGRAAARPRTGKPTPRRAANGRGTTPRASAQARAQRTRHRAVRAGAKPAGAKPAHAKPAHAKPLTAKASRTRPTPQMTKAQLYGLARSAGVPKRSTMSKSELLRALDRLR